MSNIENLIERIVVLAGHADGADKSIDELYDIDRELGTDIFDSKSRKRMGEKNLPEERLHRFLNSLAEGDLKRIHSLMYAGRDAQSPAELKKYFENRGEGRDDYVRTILEKRMSLSPYLKNGIGIACRENIDLDTF